jgi:hypothetical protein
MTLWFHPLCAAYKRPQPLLEALDQTAESVADQEGLRQAVLRSVTYPLSHRLFRDRRRGGGAGPSLQSHLERG